MLPNQALSNPRGPRLRLPLLFVTTGAVFARVLFALGLVTCLVTPLLKPRTINAAIGIGTAKRSARLPFPRPRRLGFGN